MTSNDSSAKSILAEALHKANNAVIFDHRQNFGEAIRAYGESCALLGQVMRVSLDDGDRSRLEAIATDVCTSPPHGTVSATVSSLQDEVLALRNDLQREQQRNTELENICRELNEDNDKYLNVALQLENAVAKLLGALSLPTDSLYVVGVTDYHGLHRLVDDESPRLATVTKALDLLASLAVGLNSSINVHQAHIRSLQEEIARLEDEKAGIKLKNEQSTPSLGSSIDTLREWDCTETALLHDADSSTTTSGSKSQDFVPMDEPSLPVAAPASLQQKLSRNIGNVQLPKIQGEFDKPEDLEHDARASPDLTDGEELSPSNSDHQENAAFHIFDSLSTPDTNLEINCAISVNEDRLAGNPFFFHPGWQIQFSTNTHPENPHINLNFRLAKTKYGKTGKCERAKGFGLMWKLSKGNSFELREVKAYKPSSLRDLPLSLTNLCADRHVRGTLWLVSLAGVYGSPPPYSRKVLENLDKDMKSNLKELFRPKVVNQINIWFINPKEGDRRKQRLDTAALIALKGRC